MDIECSKKQVHKWLGENSVIHSIQHRTMMKDKNLNIGLLALLGCFVIIGMTERLRAAPLVKKIEVRGNRALSQGEVLDGLSISKNQPLPAGWPEQSFHNLAQRYLDKGYWAFSIPDYKEVYSNDSTEIRISLVLNEGQAVRVGAMRFHGLPPELLPLVQKEWQLRSGSVFSSAILESEIEALLQFFENRGYPLTVIRTDSLIYTPDSDHPCIDIHLAILNGEPVRIGALSVSGNTLTKTPVVLRETRLRAGDLYDHQKLDAAQSHLQRLEYFRSVGEPAVRFHGPRADILFNVEEGNANHFDGVIGYAPSVKEDEPGYVTGRMEFSFKNLFGTGRKVEAYWEKKDAHSQAVRLGYEEPWIGHWPVSLGGMFSQEIRDTLYVDREWRLSSAYSPWTTLTLNLEGGRRQILPDSMGSVLYDLTRSSTWFVEGGLSYTTFDLPINPRNGIYYATSVRTGQKKHLGPDSLVEALELKKSVHVRQISIDFQTAVNPIGRQVVFAGLDGREVKTGDRVVSIGEQIRFGGAKTLRGYQEEFFRGTLVAWMNLEYRYLLGRRSRAFLFLDSGFYQRKEENGEVRDTKIGYGMGLRLDTRLGVMGIDYGLGEGDGLMQGKIHVGLINTF